MSHCIVDCGGWNHCKWQKGHIRGSMQEHAHLALPLTVNEWPRHYIVGTLWPNCHRKSSYKFSTLRHIEPYISINFANTGSGTNAHDTVRLAIGVSLRAKNKSGKNLMKYIWIKMYICWLLLSKHLWSIRNSFICIVSLNMPHFGFNLEKNGPLVCHCHWTIEIIKIW